MNCGPVPELRMPLAKSHRSLHGLAPPTLPALIWIKPKAAEECYREAIAKLPETQNTILHADILFEQSAITHSHMDTLALMKKSWEIAGRYGAPNAAAKAKYALGAAKVYLNQNSLLDIESQTALYNKLENCLTCKGNHHVTQALIYQGQILQLQRKPLEAKTKLEEALTTATKYYGDRRPPIFGEIYLAFARVDRDEQNFGIARKNAQLALDVFNQYPFDADHPLLVEALRLVGPQTSLAPQASTLASPSSGASSSSSQASAVTRLSSGASSSNSQSATIAGPTSNSHSFGSSTGPACFSPPPSSSSSSSAPVAPVGSITPTTVDPEAAARILASFTPIAPKQ